MQLAATSSATLRMLIVGWALPLAAQQGPCDQITAACKSAGFLQGEASKGTGLQADCIIPIMQGITRPIAATLPLPHIAPKVVAACKTNHPDFGQQKNIETKNFQFGVENQGTTGTSKATKEGNDSAALNEIDSAIGHRPVVPTYKGPSVHSLSSDSAGTNSNGSLSPAIPPGFNLPSNKPPTSAAATTSAGEGLPPATPTSPPAGSSAGTNSNGSLSPAPPPGFNLPSNKPPPHFDTSLTAGAGAAPHKFRLIVWTNGTPTVLPGLSNATGPGGTALPTTAEVRAQARMVQPPVGVVIIHTQNGSPASRALSKLGVCNPPACAVEIDQLGASGAVVHKYRFTGGQAVGNPGIGAQPLESVSFTYGKIIVRDVQQDSGQGSVLDSSSH